VAGSSTPEGQQPKTLGCQQSGESEAAGRSKSSATWKVGNVSERAKVRRCTAVEHLVYQDGNLGPVAFRKTQPMKSDECVRDVVGATHKAEMCYQSIVEK